MGGDVQLVATQSGENDKRYFTLTFIDMFGGEFTTRPILDKAPTCIYVKNEFHPCPEIQYALMDLPNFAIPEVEVDLLYQDTAAGKTTSLYPVQFTDPSNSGKQNTLECNVIETPTVDGAQPKYEKVDKCKVYNVGGPEWFTESGEANVLNLKADTFPDNLAAVAKDTILSKENKADENTTYEDFQPCSSKGDCDAATGTCTCNSGHYGEACEKQSTYY